MTDLDWTGERYLPEVDGEIELEHYHRYLLSRKFSVGKNVLDIACGEGYGSSLLAKVAASVIGVDISEKVIEHARESYSQKNIEFLHGSCSDIPLSDESIDVVVSFETIEHHNKHEEMMHEIKRVLKKDGLLIISSPDKKQYSDIPNYKNEYHVKELYLPEFQGLLERNFGNVLMLGQKIKYGSLIAPFSSDLLSRFIPFEKNSNNSELFEPLYLIAIASDEKITSITSSFYATSVQDSEYVRNNLAKLNQLEKEQLLTQGLIVERESKLEDISLKLKELEEKNNRKLHQLELKNESLKIEQVRLQGKIKEKEIRLKDVSNQVKVLDEEKNLALNELHSKNDKLQEDLARIQEIVIDKKRQLKEMSKQLKVLDDDNNKELHRLHQEIERLGKQNTEATNFSTELLNSNSWKLMAPFRWLREIIRVVLNKAHLFFIEIIRYFYFCLPLSYVRKQRLKKWGYENFPFLFRPTESYKLWIERKHRLGEKIDFEEFKKPKVSIIIPVHGKIEFTHRCLKSIKNILHNYSYEVIIVDDSSLDDTLEVLNNFSGIRVFKNQKNLGFIRSCNLGAKYANGEYLLFLNNDTEVLSGWLDELINTFKKVNKAGLVGSKLIYPEGRLQEAGGIIWSDGSGWNYGRGDDPNRPEYCYLREVDYCSGASIMVPITIFKEVGGFDERYVPAYYEDTDLAFSIREAGYRVLYQPLSEVIHYEGITSGTDLNKGIKSYQKINAKKFYHKWEKVLKKHGVNGTHVDQEKERVVDKRVLIIDACTPTPDKDSGSVDAMSYIDILISLGYKVTFIPADNLSFIERYTTDLQRKGVECLYQPFLESVESHLKEKGNSYSVVFLNRVIYANAYIGFVEKYSNAKTVFNTVDLHHLRMERQAEIEKSASLAEEASKYKDMELEAMGRTDKTIVLSSAERALLEKENVEINKIHVIPLIRPIPGINTKVSFEQRRGIVFVGGFNHSPNGDAVAYFCNEIWPMIKVNLPDAKFYIIGSEMPDEVKKLENIEGVVAVGYVEDLATYFDKCRLSVAPLRYGAGLKGKVGASLAYGLPCVATSIATEGSGLVYGKHVLVADSPSQFALSVCKVYKDKNLWNDISECGLNFVRDNFSFEAGREKVKNLLGTFDDYERRKNNEIQFYKEVENVHNLPEIFHYWSNKYLLPKMKTVGINGVNDFYLSYIKKACKKSPIKKIRVVSIGAGNCDLEIELTSELEKKGFKNFKFECIDINPNMLLRGEQLSVEKSVDTYFKFIQTDIKSWNPEGEIDIVIANQSLHHFIDLEILFEKILASLSEDGVFLTSDMIGRNGHMRWPEALRELDSIWRTMPDKYKYNHLLKRVEKEYDNWDCSKEGFEGIRAQDILPLLIKYFNFEIFLAYNNVVTVFIDRCFGHNFNSEFKSDCDFIDKVAALDENLIEKGVIKPTQLIAALKVTQVKNPRFYKHLNPDFCLRPVD